MRTHACCCWGYGICIAVLPQAEEEDMLGHEKLKSVSSPPQDCRGVACDKRTARSLTANPPACIACLLGLQLKGIGKGGKGQNNFSLWMSWVRKECQVCNPILAVFLSDVCVSRFFMSPLLVWSAVYLQSIRDTFSQAQFFSILCSGSHCLPGCKG